MRKKIDGYTIFRFFNIIGLLIISFLTLYPFIYMFAVSFSSSSAVLTGNVNWHPIDFTIISYQEIVGQLKFWTGYRNTFIYTLGGTVLSLVLTIMCAYPLSKKSLYGRNGIMKFIVFTMFFSGGLIPFYLVISSFKMVNTVWAIIIPGAVNAYNVLIMRTFFMGIPSSLGEAAEIDGLNQIQILIQIILPLSMPIIATVGLFNAVWYYNDWFNALIFLNDEKLYPVTMYLRNIMLGTIMASKSGVSIDASSTRSISQTLQAASTMLVLVPMLISYPVVQKYFVKGVMIGSVKG